MDKKELTFEDRMAILTKPIERPRWRVQALYPKNGTKTFCVVVPYIDARIVEERFDTAFGADNWRRFYEPETGLSTISVRVNGEWIDKSDVGTETKVDGIKGKSSDALKRSAVLWGLGRELYLIGEKTLPVNEKGIPLSLDKTTLLKTPTAISNYMNKISESVGLLYQLWNLNKDKQVDDNFKDLISKLKEYVK